MELILGVMLIAVWVGWFKGTNDFGVTITITIVLGLVLLAFIGGGDTPINF